MLPKLQNDRFIRALLHQPVDVTPIWIMRQAGRYLPEYRALRADAGDFLTLCKTPELACEATMQPIRRYPLDAAILFSDILTIPDAMGLGLSFPESEGKIRGPKFEQVVRDQETIEALPIPNPNTDLGYVMEAIRQTRIALDGQVPLIGFSGSPWTLSVYMIEGSSSKDFHHVKALLYTQPSWMHALLSKLADAVFQYLEAQIIAGAQAVMLFDTWGGILTGAHYRSFSLSYLREIVHRLRDVDSAKEIPIIIFTKGAGLWVDAIADTGCDAIGLDWSQDIGRVRSQLGDKVSLQGNLDPGVLYGSPNHIRTEVKIILDNYGKGTGHVFNLGHGIQKYVNPENVEILVDTVHEYSRRFHE